MTKRRWEKEILPHLRDPVSGRKNYEKTKCFCPHRRVGRYLMLTKKKFVGI